MNITYWFSYSGKRPKKTRN